ncbi:MAG: phosphatase PAP2 family protein [Chromatiales bacterium]|nr:phosphatase PAP2 family protein [Chromatiales bacterium]
MFAALLFRNRLVVALCFAWAVALGLSRLALAKHYPSDALAGALIAVFVSLGGGALVADPAARAGIDTLRAALVAGAGAMIASTPRLRV